MSDLERPPAQKGLLARGLKKLGELTHPDTRSGRVFTQAEQRLTQALARVAESPTYLRVSGTLMRQGFNTRIRRNSVLERALHQLRMPTTSEVETLREQLRRMNDQVEALGSQLELVVDLLHRQEAQQASRPRDSDPPSTEPRA